MPGIFRKSPTADGIDHAARQILNLLDREEREKQALRRLQAENWRPPARDAAPTREVRFGDGRDDLMQLVQSDLDRRQALQDQARRRVQLAQAENELPLPPRKPGIAAIPPRKPPVPPPSWLRDTRAVQIIGEVLTQEGGYSNRSTKDDPGGKTMRGITIDRLRFWHRRHPDQAGTGHGQIPTDIRKLTDDNAIRILKEDFYDPFRIAEINDSRLANQLADIAINSSPEGFTHIVNGALNELMHENGMFGEAIRPRGAGVFKVDPVTGKRSWYLKPSRYGGTAIERLNRLADGELGQELKNAIVRHRMNYLKQLPSFDANPGWPPRALRFVEWTDSPEDRKPSLP
ncbi:MAG: glycosyl hydrolase 108 family protein [Dongiaceae bacterium]